MSVHTWTYKKVSALSEEKKLDIVERAIDAADWWERKEELADLQKHGFDALRKHDILGVNFIDHNGETYFLIGCDVPVRVHPKKSVKHPKETFTDSDKFLEFLRTTDCDILLCDVVSEGFVDHVHYHNGYCDEVIRSVKEYFAEHGENNLYIKFA